VPAKDSFTAEQQALILAASLRSVRVAPSPGAPPQRVEFAERLDDDVVLHPTGDQCVKLRDVGAWTTK